MDAVIIFISGMVVGAGAVYFVARNKSQDINQDF